MRNLRGNRIDGSISFRSVIGFLPNLRLISGPLLSTAVLNLRAASSKLVGFGEGTGEDCRAHFEVCVVGEEKIEDDEI